MKKLGKKIAALLLCTILLPSYSATVFATDYSHQEYNTTVDPRLALISSARCSLRISGNTATVTVSMSGKVDVTDCKVEVDFQKENGNSWITVSSDNDSSSSRNGAWTFKFPVTSGQTYRAQVTFTAYSDTNDESITKESNVETA